MPSASSWNAPTAYAPSAPAAPTSSLHSPLSWQPRKSRHPRRAAPHVCRSPDGRFRGGRLGGCAEGTCPPHHLTSGHALPNRPTTHMPSPTHGDQWTCPPLLANHAHAQPHPRPPMDMPSPCCRRWTFRRHAHRRHPARDMSSGKPAEQGTCPEVHRKSTGQFPRWLGAVQDQSAGSECRTTGPNRIARANEAGRGV